VWGSSLRCRGIDVCQRVGRFGRGNVVMVRRPASVVAATLLVFLWAACGGPLPPRGSSTTSQPLSSTVPPSTSTSVGPRGFEPGAVSFINVEQGWVLGVMGCPTCGELLSTADGGRSWSVLPVPSVPDRSQASNAVANIYFADGVNGFLFGPGLEITHDGGHTWTSGSIPSVAEVTGAAGYIYLLSQDADLMAPPESLAGATGFQHLDATVAPSLSGHWPFTRPDHLLRACVSRAHVASASIGFEGPRENRDSGWWLVVKHGRRC